MSKFVINSLTSIGTGFATCNRKKMKRESCSEASDSWTFHDFPCLLGSEKLVFNYRYEKYIVETSFCWGQGKHYALSLLPKHLTRSTHSALPAPLSAPYPLYPQYPACSTQSALPTLPTVSYPTCSALPAPPTAPYQLHPQNPTPLAAPYPPPPLRLLWSCAAFTNHTGVQYPLVPAASLEPEQGSAVRKCFLNERHGLQNWYSDDLYQKRVTLDGWRVVLRNRVPGVRGAFQWLA